VGRPIFDEARIHPVIRGKIAAWRREQSLERTLERRPDLLEARPYTA